MTHLNVPEENTPPAPGALEERLHEATRMTDEGLWEDAFQLLLELEADYPEDSTLLCMLGVVATEVDARGVAYDYFRRSLATEPQDPFVLVALGSGLARYDDPDAEGVLRLAAITAPDLALARLHYGAYLAREGLPEQAIEELRAAHGLEPENPMIERELGVAHILAGGIEEGLARLESAAALGGDDPELQLLYGLGLLQARRDDEAAEQLHRASLELAEDGDVQIAAALAAAAQGWVDEAWNALARAESAPHPPDPEVLRETEEALEGGEEAAAALLAEQIAPPLFHDRLLERP